MIESLATEVRRAPKGLVLDTNVFLLLLIGTWGKARINQFKRTQRFTESDYDNLLYLCGSARRLVVTPHVITEACNLCDNHNANFGGAVFETLVEMSSSMKERRKESFLLFEYSEFLRFGLADVSILDASLKSHIAVTDEAKLYAAISAAGGFVINLNHIRSLDWIN